MLTVSFLLEGGIKNYVYNIGDLLEIFSNSHPKFVLIFIEAAKKLECKSSNPLVKSVTLKQMKRIVVISFVPKMLFFILLVYCTFYQKEAIF